MDVPSNKLLNDGSKNDQNSLDSREKVHELTPQTQNAAMKISSSELASAFPYPVIREESPWNVILVNHIPKQAVREEIIFVFMEYGEIADVYLPEKPSYYKHEHKGFARITFKNEADARRVWSISQSEGIKYEDYVMSITLVSEDYSPIEELPDTCLYKIFLHLSYLEDKIALEYVCKRWREIGSESWSNITEIRERSSKEPRWEVTITRARNSLRILRIRLEERSTQLLSLLNHYCTKLEEIDIQLPVNFVPLLPQLELLFQRNTHLRRLFITFTGQVHIPCKTHSNVSPEKVTDIHCLSHVSATLKELHLDRRGGPVPPLTVLNLFRFQDLQVFELQNLTVNENHLKGIESLQKLTKIKFYYCNIDSSNIEGITNLTKLNYLSISGCEITDPVFSIILKNNKGLKYLNISGIRSITDESFMYVQHLPELQVLSMTDMPEVTDEYLCNMPKLKGLACNSTEIYGKGLEKFLETASSIEKIFACYCPISLASISNVQKWTVRTGRYLTLFLDDIKSSEYYRKVGNHNQGLLNVEHHVFGWQQEHPEQHDWGENLLD